MSRTILPLHVEDISSFARALGRQLAAFERTPGHVELLQMLAKARGYRNFQHFRAQQLAATQLQTPPPPEPEADMQKVARMARFFDSEARLIRWPKKFSQQGLCLWALWARFPARQPLHELELNARLQALHLFEDHALLRREFVDRGLFERTADGREYRRLEKRPPVDARALIACLPKSR